MKPFTNTVHSMEPLDRFPALADKALGGLVATEDMRYQIQMKALKRQSRQRVRRTVGRIAIPAVCAVLVLALFIYSSFDKTPLNTLPSITTLPYGVIEDSSAFVSDGEHSLTGEVSVSGNRTLNSSGIWAAPATGSFPLIGLSGNYYRMVSTPSCVDDALKGSLLGTVEEYTTEPSLSRTDVVISNCVWAGEDVYGISGMEKSLVCAKVDGSLRLFQRVSFNGYATIGKESLADTLQFQGHIASLTLSGIGTVSGATASSLFETLLHQASYESSGSLNTEDTLLITLDNGLCAQMLLKDDRLSACGVWSCPEFVEAFRNAVR